MKRPREPVSETEDNDGDFLRTDLRDSLAPRVTAKKIADLIKKFLEPLKKFDKTVFPDELARELIKIYPTAASAELDRLIRQRPRELNDILWLSLQDDLRAMVSFNGGVFRKERRRTRNPTDAQRLKNIAASKAAYELKRRLATQSYIGTERLIEQQFSTGIVSPMASCLDKILLGKGAIRLIGWGGLICLFGIARHDLPQTITRTGNGQYDHRGIFQCMDALLSERPGRWLADHERRGLVLNGVIERARTIKAPAKIQRALRKTLLPHLR